MEKDAILRAGLLYPLPVLCSLDPWVGSPHLHAELLGKEDRADRLQRVFLPRRSDSHRTDARGRSLIDHPKLVSGPHQHVPPVPSEAAEVLQKDCSLPTVSGMTRFKTRGRLFAIHAVDTLPEDMQEWCVIRVAMAFEGADL
jgi:hypothetical protein